MSKFYKTMGSCRMCKTRFEVKKTAERPFASKYYCLPCIKKYFTGNSGA